MKKYYIIFLILSLTIILLSTVSAENNTNTINIKKHTNNNQINTNKIVQEKNIQTSKELDDQTEGTGCVTTIIQGYNNDSSISYRRDATNKLTINVKHKIQ